MEEGLHGRFLDLRRAFVDQTLECEDGAVVLQSADRLDGPDLEFGMMPVAGILDQRPDIRSVEGQRRQEVLDHARSESARGRSRPPAGR